MYDFNGSAIDLGSRVAWFKGGRYDALVIGVVVQTKTQVQIEVEKATRPELHVGGKHWAPSDRVVVLGGEPTEHVEWGVAYRLVDGSLFVDEAVDEDDARQRVEWGAVYDLVVRRLVGPWKPAAPGGDQT